MTNEQHPDAQQEAAPSDSTEDFMLRAFFGHHKCATGWISDILREICFHLGRSFRIVHGPRHLRPYRSFDAFVEQEGIDILAYTNAEANQVRDLPPHRGFHVVRDPRDVLVSAYFSHRYSHPTEEWPALPAHRKALNKLSEKEGLFKEMEFSQTYFDQMQQWDYEQDNIVEIKLEELSPRPVAGFTKIARFMSLLEGEAAPTSNSWRYAAQMRLNRLNQRGRRFMPGKIPMFPVPRRRLYALTPSMLETILHRKSFKKMAGGRKKGEENVKSHYRKGQPGDWKNHLDADHISRFKEKYNDLLLKLNYETTPDW